MSYHEKLGLGMTQKEVVEILGEPDHTRKAGDSIHWEWFKLTDEEGEYQAFISFFDGVVSSISFEGKRFNYDGPPLTEIRIG